MLRNIKENEKLNVMNHSCAHLLAQAVKHLYPKALFWVGPVIEEGFYYDIDLGEDVIKDSDLEKIENMAKALEIPTFKLFIKYNKHNLSNRVNLEK